jgi:hypothetical protein
VFFELIATNPLNPIRGLWTVPNSAQYIPFNGRFQEGSFTLKNLPYYNASSKKTCKNLLYYRKNKNRLGREKATVQWKRFYSPIISRLYIPEGKINKMSG